MNLTENPPELSTCSVWSICSSRASFESAPPTTSSTYILLVSMSKARGESSLLRQASRLSATAAWFPVLLTPYQARVITYTSGLTPSLRDGWYRNSEYGSADSSKNSRLYSLEMSVVHADLCVRRRMRISGIWASIFSPLARIRFRPVQLGSTTSRHGVDTLPGL